MGHGTTYILNCEQLNDSLCHSKLYDLLITSPLTCHPFQVKFPLRRLWSIAKSRNQVLVDKSHTIFMKLSSGIKWSYITDYYSSFMENTKLWTIISIVVGSRLFSRIPGSSIHNFHLFIGSMPWPFMIRFQTLYQEYFSLSKCVQINLNS